MTTFGGNTIPPLFVSGGGGGGPSFANPPYTLTDNNIIAGPISLPVPGLVLHGTNNFTTPPVRRATNIINVKIDNIQWMAGFGATDILITEVSRDSVLTLNLFNSDRPWPLGVQTRMATGTNDINRVSVSVTPGTPTGTYIAQYQIELFNASFPAVVEARAQLILTALQIL